MHLFVDPCRTAFSRSVSRLGHDVSVRPPSRRPPPGSRARDRSHRRACGRRSTGARSAPRRRRVATRRRWRRHQAARGRRSRRPGHRGRSRRRVRCPPDRGARSTAPCRSRLRPASARRPRFAPLPTVRSTRAARRLLGDDPRPSEVLRHGGSSVSVPSLRGRCVPPTRRPYASRGSVPDEGTPAHGIPAVARRRDPRRRRHRLRGPGSVLAGILLIVVG